MADSTGRVLNNTNEEVEHWTEGICRLSESKKADTEVNTFAKYAENAVEWFENTHPTSSSSNIVNIVTGFTPADISESESSGN